MQISKVHGLMAKAMDFRALRSDLIASNLSNVDTPFYKSRDVRFEEALTQQVKKVFKQKREDLTLMPALTQKGHMLPPDIDNDKKAVLFYRDGNLSRNDSNSVDIDVESTELSKNLIMFNALAAAIKKDTNMFKSVVTSSEKLS